MTTQPDLAAIRERHAKDGTTIAEPGVYPTEWQIQIIEDRRILLSHISALESQLAAAMDAQREKDALIVEGLIHWQSGPELRAAAAAIRADKSP